jgi:hypothetical protein
LQSEGSVDANSIVISSGLRTEVLAGAVLDIFGAVSYA